MVMFVNQKKKITLHVNIPNGIIEIINIFYPKIFHFDSYDKTSFDLSEDKTIICGKKHDKWESGNCVGFTVHSESIDILQFREIEWKVRNEILHHLHQSDLF